MANTPNLDMERLTEGQASGEITHNEAINKLDSLVMGGIKDRDLLDPPGAPSNGDRYLIDGVGINGWAGEDDNLAIYYDGWVFITPSEGWVLWVDDENIQIVYDGSVWITRASHARKESTETVNQAGTGSTYQDDDDLLFAMRANEIWQCHAVLIVQDQSAGQAAGLKFKWTLPAGGTLTGTYTFIDTAANSVTQAELLAANGNVVITLPDANIHYIPMHFMAINAEVLGNLQLEWAQVNADAGDLNMLGAVNASSHLYGIRMGYGQPLS